VRKLFVLVSALALSACSVEPGSEKWCKQMGDTPKSEWTMSDAGTYAKNCVIDGMEVGSKKWCEDLEEKPKGDWTANESTTYAKHCIM